MHETALPVTPAGRLNIWLGRAATYAESAAHVSASRPGPKRKGHHGSDSPTWLQPSNALVAWCSIWDLDVSTKIGRGECYRRGMDLVGEGVAVRRSAEAVARDLPLVASALEHFQSVERSLSYFTSLRSTPITHMIKHIRAPGWQALRTLDEHLLSSSREARTSLEAITGLLHQTDAAIRTVVSASDLSPEARDELVARLRAIRASLERFTVSGPSDLVATVDSTMGLMMRLYLRGVDVSRHPATRATLALIAAAALMLGMGADYLEIAGSPLGRMLGIGKD